MLVQDHSKSFQFILIQTKTILIEHRRQVSCTLHCHCTSLFQNLTVLQLNKCVKITEVLAEVSFDWVSIVHSIYVADENQKWFILYGTNITWSFNPQYPACQVVNLNDYIDFSKSVPSYVEFYFNNIPNLALSIKIEDIRKSLPKRPLISNSNDYDGVPLHIENLTSGQFYDFSLTLTETNNKS